MSYQGYRNHTTWCVQMWLSEDAVMHAACRRLVAAQPVRTAGKLLEEYTREKLLEGDVLSGIQREILSSAISFVVDWGEIAEVLCQKRD